MDIVVLRGAGHCQLGHRLPQPLRTAQTADWCTPDVWILSTAIGKTCFRLSNAAQLMQHAWRLHAQCRPESECLRCFFGDSTVPSSRRLVGKNIGHVSLDAISEPRGGVAHAPWLLPVHHGQAAAPAWKAACDCSSLRPTALVRTSDLGFDYMCLVCTWRHRSANALHRRAWHDYLLSNIRTSRSLLANQLEFALTM